MPVHRKKKDTTTNTPGSTQEQTVPLPDQQEFHQHLRELARGAIRVVLEGVMHEELDTLIGEGTSFKRWLSQGWFFVLL